MTGPASIVYGVRPGCPALAHATAWAYARHGCRCADALGMVRRADRERRRRARARLRLTAEAPEHRFDETRVDLACAGWPARGLTVAERVEALERLYRRGLSVQEIATRLGLPAWVVQERVTQYQIT